jgi:hypothetical protein
LVTVDWNVHWTVVWDAAQSQFALSAASHAVTANYDTTLYPTWDEVIPNGS